MKKIIDLHIHSTNSDGILTPFEIIDVAVKNKVNTIAISDHDTTKAYTKKLFDYAFKNHINLIPAVEISTKYRNKSIHILGYNIDINNKKLIEKLSILRNSRHNYLYNVTKKLNDLGYIVNLEKLDLIDSVTKAHIAIDIITNKKNQKLLLLTFNHIPSKGEFIETIMNHGCPAYIKKESISPIDAANLIREAKGFVVLAHPVAYIHESNFTTNDIINIIMDIKADGIESNYIYIDSNNTIINEINKWNKISKRLNLLSTIGSDFHDFDNIHPEIGSIQKYHNICEKEISNILKQIKNNQ